MQDKAYGRAALVAGEEDTEDVMRRFRAVQEKIGEILEGVDAKPSLLHGDLWIGDLSHTSPTPPPPTAPPAVTEIDAPLPTWSLKRQLVVFVPTVFHTVECTSACVINRYHE